MTLETDLASLARLGDREDRELVEQLEFLIRHPAWPTYVSFLDRLIAQRGEELLEPAGSFDGTLRVEYQKGTMRGLLLARNLPSVIVESVKQQLGPSPADAAQEDSE